MDMHNFGSADLLQEPGHDLCHLRADALENTSDQLAYRPSVIENKRNNLSAQIDCHSQELTRSRQESPSDIGGTDEEVGSDIGPPLKQVLCETPGIAVNQIFSEFIEDDGNVIVDFFNCIHDLAS